MCTSIVYLSTLSHLTTGQDMVLTMVPMIGHLCVKQAFGSQSDTQKHMRAGRPFKALVGWAAWIPSNIIQKRKGQE